jgi:hypothetical protein
MQNRPLKFRNGSSNLHRFISLVAAGSISIALSAKELSIYVSPMGNDAWSGLAASPASDGKAGPLATLEMALKKARQARTGPGAADQVGIVLRDGFYPLSEPIRMTAEDSGASTDKPLTIAAYPNEKPILSGGRVIAGWKKMEASPLWYVDIPEARDNQWQIRQLFVNDTRKQRARTPNTGYFRIQGESPKDHPVKLKYKPGDIKPEWARDGNVEVVAFLSWADFRLQIRAVDDASHVATLSGDPADSNKENDGQYCIENAPDGLDMPGEWYLNYKTGRLSYWPESGEDMTRARVIAPKLTELMQIKGAANNAVRNIVFKGLSFAHTDWTLGEHGYTDVQAAFAIAGDVRFESASDCAIDDCTFTHLGGYALDIGRDCRQIKVRHNAMSDLGAGAIRIGVPDAAADKNNFGHEIADNHIHHLGEVYKPAIGVLILQSGKNRVAHNHIHDLYYTAISVGWNWGYQETPCRENIVEFNHLHDIGKSLLSDMGAIYTLGIQEGTVIRNNLIHDVYSFTYGGWGIYPDEGSTHILIENNIVYRTKSAGFHQHYGKENIVRNNIFAFGTENQLMRSRAEEHSSFTFENNIVYFNSGNLLGSNWSGDKYRMDNNLYFDTRLGAAPEKMTFSGASFEDWRKRGHDVHSQVADPLFTNPSSFNFTLKPESPALKLGFKPIDMSKVGVRPAK